jgi:apolipoprotein D and lipocalin family protein
MAKILRAAGVACCAFMFGCTTKPPLPTVPQVDLPRFMGDWYVIAHIPTSAEKNSFNAVESYRLDADQRILTTFVFREGGFDGEIQVMEPNGVVWDTKTNATWGMKFWWPFRFEYLITWLDADYSATIVSRTRRDYVWIMARTPTIDPRKLDELTAVVAQQGYDVSKLRLVPQKWPDPAHPKNK